MIDQAHIAEVSDRDVYASDGDKLGQAGQIYLDDETGRPEWVTINTGFFGSNESFVPLREAELGADGVRVPYTKDQVKDAPNVDPSEGHLSPEQENELYAYYGMTESSAAVGKDDDPDADLLRGQTEEGREGRSEDRDRARETDASGTDETMTRSEEQLAVGTRSREAGRARLRKYVVTEEQTVTVPVTREEVRVEREPITDANMDEATSGAEISEAEHEVTLHEEEVVVEKKTVPVERVSLATESVTEQREVSEEVRKEQIETEGVDELRDSDRDRDESLGNRDS